MFVKVRKEGICVLRLILDVLTDAPLTPKHVLEVVKDIHSFKQFCRHLHIAERQSVVKTLQFYVEEPYFEASWKEIALALYHSHEERSIDSISHYMKSPPG